MRRTVLPCVVFAAFVLGGCGRAPSPRVVTSGLSILATRALAENPHPAWQENRVLRVCADPDNLPFSNLAEEGVENRLAEIVAADLGARLEYTWWPRRRGVVHHPLKTRKCDLILSLPANLDRTQPTAAYYHSSYVFVTRRERGLRISSLDDPVLQRLRIGLRLSGTQADPAIAAALARRGSTSNVAGYGLSADSSSAVPQGGLLQAVERGEVDVAIVWGPLAGYFAKRTRAGVALQPVLPQGDRFPPLAYGVAAGVRSGDTTTRRILEEAFTRHAGAIHRLLLDYGFPLLDVGPGSGATGPLFASPALVASRR
jgi:mxaJ protein